MAQVLQKYLDSEIPKFQCKLCLECFWSLNWLIDHLATKHDRREVARELVRIYVRQ